MHAVYALVVGLLAMACVGCSDSGNNRLRGAPDLKATVAAHQQWLAAGGCAPGEDGRVDREDPSLKTDSIGDLQPVSFFRTDLHRADFSNQDLRCASFIGANLTDANFFGADLRGAFFNRATLLRANFERTDLRGTILHNADLQYLVYQPKYPPLPPSLALSTNLNYITYNDDPTFLYSLKNALKERGYQDAQKSVIAALRRSHPPEDSLGSKFHLLKGNVARAIQFVLFDWTSEFGSNSFRPLLIILMMWLLCGAVYAAAVLREGKAGLFLVSTGERIPKGKKTPYVRRIRPAQLQVAPRIRSAISSGLFFSFRRTFHFGFKELDFGNWLKLLQSREFDIIAYGWPRVVSGVQSILSIYLLALSILSAFTTPFDL